MNGESLALYEPYTRCPIPLNSTSFHSKLIANAIWQMPNVTLKKIQQMASALLRGFSYCKCNTSQDPKVKFWKTEKIFQKRITPLIREHFVIRHMVSEKIYIANVRSLTRRPTTFLKFADDVGPCGRAGYSRKSPNELSRTFGFRLIKCSHFGHFSALPVNPTRGRMESYCKCIKHHQSRRGLIY
jgi:hypothetical protein